MDNSKAYESFYGAPDGFIENSKVQGGDVGDHKTDVQYIYDDP